MLTYNQCKLVKGNVSQVAYIPTKYAEKGRTIKIKENEVWEDGWIVQSVGRPVAENLLPDSHKAIKGHRKMTGDSMKKVKND